MNRLKKISQNLERRKLRIRSKVTGSKDRPRLSVHISLKHVSAQLIDDTAHNTLAHVTTASKDAPNGSRTQQSEWVGQQIAKTAQAKKIKKAVFDRNGRLYHGRVKALAEAARKQGLEL